jgi:probable biosynthetic protein (TIGR04098 family)
MSGSYSLLSIQGDLLERVDARTLLREVTVKPGMCGHNALLVGQIGDWTWETVSRLCGMNAFQAVDAEGNPTYLSFYYYQVLGDRRFHLRSPTFGDRLQVVSTCYGFGSESVLTVHRLASAQLGLHPVLGAEELHRARRPGCLYVQNVNRWIRRGATGNKELYAAAPVGFRQAHLATLAPELSPRLAYDTARRLGAFAPESGSRPAGEWTLSYEVDLARDLNGVGLLCFASYFSIADGALAKVWQRLGRSGASFLERVVLDTQLCFLGNAEPGTVLTLQVRRSVGEGGEGWERFDIQIREEETQRMLAVVAMKCQGSGA